MPEQLALQKTPLIPLTDGATVTIDRSLGGPFHLNSSVGRIFSIGTAGYDGQRVLFSWKNTSGAGLTHSLTTGAANQFRFKGSATALNSTAAGVTERVLAIYNAADSRWDVEAYSGFDFPQISQLIDTKLIVMAAAIEGKDCVLSGGAVAAQGSPDMTVAVAKCGVLSNGVLRAVAGANGTITAADSTNPRYDLVVINSSGAIAVRAGTASAVPIPPARSANDVVLAIVYVPAGGTAISSDQITDVRGNRFTGPIQIYKTTTVETTNNTAAAVHVLDKTNSGVAIPNGLFLAGRTLRCRIGGNFLLNSGTPTITLTISYGGTTMFADATIIGAADADRGAWFIDFQIAAQANNDQALSGSICFDPTIAQRIAPTTGIAGNLSMSGTAANQQHIAPFAGSSAVDSDAANRTLAVTLTMSVANAANEIVTESATLEIL